MVTLDDLLIKRRRGTLSEVEARRLSAALRATREYELALLAGDVFEREGAAAPDDAQRLRALVANAERRFSNLPRAELPSAASRQWFSLGRVSAWLSPRAFLARLSPRGVRALAVAPVFVAAIAAASIEGYRAFEALRDAGTPAPPTASAVSHPRKASPARLPASPPAPPEPPPAAPVPPSPSPPASIPRSAPAPARTRLIDPPRAQQQPSPAPSPRAATRAPVPPSTAALHPADAPPLASDVDTARVLFRRANGLRRTDWLAAAAIYSELIRRHPASLEAGIAELALGKWSLAQGRSGDALEWFRAHQRRPQSELGAEALWGEARALESLGSHVAARTPWRALMDRYPDSPYAAVARERLERR
jgi:TolA-binding protein